MREMLVAMHAQTHVIIFPDDAMAEVEFKKFQNRLSAGPHRA
jgi:hypothetical protein